MPDDKLKILYDNIIGTGKITQKEMGDFPTFSKLMSDSTNVRTFYDNVISSGIVSPTEMGDFDTFYKYIKPQEQAIQPPPKRISPTEQLQNIDNLIADIDSKLSAINVSEEIMGRYTPDVQDWQANIGDPSGSLENLRKATGEVLPEPEKGYDPMQPDALMIEKIYLNDAKDLATISQKVDMPKEAYAGVARAMNAPLGIARAITSNRLLKDFASNGATKMARDYDIQRIKQKALNNNYENLTPAEEQLLIAEGTLQAIRDGNTDLEWIIGNGLAEVVPYMIEFAATKGANTAVRGGINALLKSTEPLVGKGLLKYFSGQGAKKLFSYTVGAGAQATTMPMVERGAIERNIGQISPEGKVIAYDVMPKAILKSYGDTFVEVFSENLGEYMTLKNFFSDTGKKIATKGVPKLMSWVEKAQKQVAFDGVFKEYGEELVAWGAQPLVVEQELPQWDWKEQAATFLTVASVSGGFYVSNKAYKGYDEIANRRRYLSGLPNDIKSTVVSNVAKGKSVNEMVNTLDGIRLSGKLTPEQFGNVLQYSAKKAQGLTAEETRTAATLEIGKRRIANEMTNQIAPFVFKDGQSLFQVLDNEGNVFWVKDGQIDVNQEDGTWTIGKQPLIVVPMEGGEPRMMASTDVNSVRHSNMTDKISEQIAQFQQQAEMEKTLTDAAEILETEAAEAATPDLKTGDNVLYNGRNAVINSVGSTAIDAQFTDTDEPVVIPPEQYSNLQKVEAQPTAQATVPTTAQPEDGSKTLTAKVGKNEVKVKFTPDAQDNTLFTSDNSFSQKSDANRVIKSLSDRYSKLEFTAVDLNTDPFSDNNFVIQAKPKSAVEPGKVVLPTTSDIQQVTPEIRQKPEESGPPLKPQTNEQVQQEISQESTQPQPEVGQTNQEGQGQQEELLDEPPLRKWSINRANKPEDIAPVIDISNIDTEKSAIQEGIDEGMVAERTELVEYRGKNQWGDKVGTVRIKWRLPDGDQVLETYEVFFTPDFSAKDLKPPILAKQTPKNQASEEQPVTPVEPAMVSQNEIPTTEKVGKWKSEVGRVNLDDLIGSEYDENGDVEPIKRKYIDQYAERFAKGEDRTIILVERTPDGKYRILDGHRRVLAAKKAGLTSLPAVIRNVQGGNSDLSINMDEIDLIAKNEQIFQKPQEVVSQTEIPETTTAQAQPEPELPSQQEFKVGDKVVRNGIVREIRGFEDDGNVMKFVEIRGETIQGLRKSSDESWADHAKRIGMTREGQPQQELPQSNYAKFTQDLGLTEPFDQIEGDAKTGKIGDADIVVARDGEKVVLESVFVPLRKREKGQANAAMKAITDKADELGLDITLRAVPEVSSDMSPQQLLDWYSKFGFSFIGNKGIRVAGAETSGNVSNKQKPEPQEEAPVSPAESGKPSNKPVSETPQEGGKSESKPIAKGDEIRPQSQTENIKEQIKQAESQVDTNPTEAQKKAGNYKKGHLTLNGFDISIENPKGSTRTGVDKDGEKWENVMKHTYGYFKGSEGRDGDQIDVFIGDNPESTTIFVVDQIDPSTGEFDESKVMMGFNSADEAKQGYLANYSAGWKGLGQITEVPVEDFKTWLYDGAKQRLPFGDYKGTPAPVVEKPKDEFVGDVVKPKAKEEAKVPEETPPEPLERNNDWIWWVRDYSTDPKQVKEAWEMERETNIPYDKLLPWQVKMLQFTVSPTFWKNEGDKNWITTGFAKRWLRKGSRTIDQIINDDLNTEDYTVEMKDVVEFMRDVSEKRISLRKTTDTQIDLERKYRELTGKSIKSTQLGSKKKDLNAKISEEIANFDDVFGRDKTDDEKINQILYDLRLPEISSVETLEAAREYFEGDPYTPEEYDLVYNYLIEKQNENQINPDEGEATAPDDRQYPEESPEVGRGENEEPGQPTAKQREIDRIIADYDKRIADLKETLVSDAQLRNRQNEAVKAANIKINLFGQAGSQGEKDMFAGEGAFGTNETEIRKGVADQVAAYNRQVNEAIKQLVQDEKAEIALVQQQSEISTEIQEIKPKSDRESPITKPADTSLDASYKLLSSVWETWKKETDDWRSNRIIWDFSMNLAGNSNKDIRRNLIWVLSGEKPKSTEIGVTNLYNLLKSTFESSNIRFQLQEDEPISDNLVALHNINEGDIRNVNKLGGMVAPSIAILQKETPYTDFGSITLIADKKTVDPNQSSVKVFKGDVYSPSVPRPKWYVNKKAHQVWVADVMHKAYAKYRDLASKVQNTIDTFGSFGKNLDSTDPKALFKSEYETMKLPYLIENGIPIKIPMKGFPIKLGFNFYVDNISPELAERALSLARKFNKEGEASSRDIKEETISDLNKLAKDIAREYYTNLYAGEEGLPEGFMEGELQNRIDRIDKSFNVNYFVDSIFASLTGSQQIDESKINESIEKTFKSKVDKKAYDEWLTDKVNEYQGAKYFEKGNQKVPYTLENLIDAVTGQTRGKEKGITFGMNRAKSFAIKQLKSVDAMHKAKKDLVTKERMTEIEQELQAEYFKLADRIKYKYSDQWGKLDDFGRSLADYYKGASAQSALIRNGFTPDRWDAEVFKEFADKLADSPVDYFEAKMQRGVDLSEFKYAIVPKDTSKDVMDILKSKGIKVKKYTTNEERSQLVDEIASKDSQVRFQLQTNPILSKDADFMGDIVFGKKYQDFLDFHTNLTRIAQRVAEQTGTKIMVVKSAGELPSYLRDAVKRKNDQGNFAPALFYEKSDGTQEVWLISNQTRSTQDAARSLLHEVIAHHGLRQLFGARYDNILRQVWAQMDDDSKIERFRTYLAGNREVFDRMSREDKLKLINNTNESQVFLMADEWLAKQAETLGDKTPTWLQKIFSQIRQMLRDVFGVNLKFTDADLKAMFAASRENLSKQAESKPITGKFAGEVIFDKETLRQQIIGEQGAQRLTEAGLAVDSIRNLQIAKDMESAGKTEKEIWLATGWQKGKDGKWRMEVPDITLKIKTDSNGKWYKSESVKLSDVINDDALFKAYPSLRDIQMYGSIDPTMQNIGGSYTPERGRDTVVSRKLPAEIKIWATTLLKYREYLIHEIQHHIQYEEGFSTGSNHTNEQQKVNFNYNLANTLINDYTKIEESDQWKQYAKIADDYVDGKVNPETYFKAYNEWISSPEYTQMKGIESEISDMGLDAQLLRDNLYKQEDLLRMAREAYINSAGEVEARNTQTRLTFDDLKRAETMLSESEDVAREDQIVLMDKVKNALDLTPEVPQTETEAFRNWFGSSKVVDENGKPLVVYSGHSNVELYGSKFDPKKATSGGFYASEDPKVASGYAMSKFGSKEGYEHGSQYRIKGKNGEFNKKLWQIELTEDQKRKLDELMLMKDEYDEYVYGISEMKNWANSNKNYDPIARRLSYNPYNLQNIFEYNEQMGYNIAYLSPKTDPEQPEYLRQNKNETERIMDALGIEWSSYDWMVPGVMPVYLSIQKPIDADKPFPTDLLQALKERAKGERERPYQVVHQTTWTKDYPLKEFIKDIEANYEGWTTQVPTKALEVFKRFGYDGIKERGAKGQDLPKEQKWVNWIAFEPTQVKSAIGNRGTFSPDNPDIRFSLRPEEKFFAEETKLLKSLSDEFGKEFGKDLNIIFNESNTTNSAYIKVLTKDYKPLITFRASDHEASFARTYGERVYPLSFDNTERWRDQILSQIEAIQQEAKDRKVALDKIEQLKPGQSIVLDGQKYKVVGANRSYVTVEPVNPVTVTLDGVNGDFAQLHNTGMFGAYQANRTKALKGEPLDDGVKLISSGDRGGVKHFVFEKTHNPIQTLRAENVANKLGYYPQPDNIRFTIQPPPPGLTEPYNPDELQPRDMFNTDNTFETKFNHAVEKVFDSMLAVKFVEDEVERRGGKFNAHSRPYREENMARSRAQAEKEKFDQTLVLPFEKAQADIIQATKGTANELTARDIWKYLVAKHAPERNRDLGKGEEGIAAGSIDGLKLTDEYANWIVEQFENEVNKYDGDLLQKLWDARNKVTRFTLDKYLASGMISREVYDKLTDPVNGWKDYVPYRGWKDSLNALFDYQSEGLSDAYNPMKKAEGRLSEADDPTVYMISMGHTAILAGAKNEYKRQMANLILLNPDIADAKDLFWFKRVYRILDDNGNIIDEMPQDKLPGLYIEKRDNGKITVVGSGVSGVRAKLKKAGGEWDFARRGYTFDPQREADLRMEFAIKPGTVSTKVTDVHQSRKPIYLAKHHEVDVWIRGERAIMVFADPKVAYALNRKNAIAEPVAQIMQRTVGTPTRYLAQVLTSKNPAFWPVNMTRDIGYAWAWHAINSDQNAAEFVRNIPTAIKATHRFLKANTEHLKGRIHGNPIRNMNDADKMYIRWKEAGGETSYFRLLDVEKIRRNVDRDLKVMMGELSLAGKMNENIIQKAGEWLGIYSQLSENISRFATYMTAYQQYRKKGVDDEEAHKRAVADSKNVTVNFDKYGRVTPLLKAFYLFIGPNLGGVYNIAKLANKNRAAFAKGALAFMMIGLASAEITRLLSPPDDDDPSLREYDTMNNFIRENYLVLPNPMWWVGDGIAKENFITIPMPQGFRAFHAAGVIISDIIHGKKTVGEGLAGFAASLGDAFMPVSMNFTAMTEGDITIQKAVRPAIPDVIKPYWDIWVTGENFAARAIFREPFTKTLDERWPEYLEANSYNNPYIVMGSKWLNRLGGGDDLRSAIYELDQDGRIIHKNGFKRLFDINPARVEYLIEAYTGGVGTELNNLVKTTTSTVQKFSGDEDAVVDTRNIPILRRFYRTASGESAFRKYGELKREVDAHFYFMNQYKKEGDLGKYSILRDNTYMQAMKKLIDRVDKRADKIEEVIDWKTQNEESAKQYFDQMEQMYRDALKDARELMKQQQK